MSIIMLIRFEVSEDNGELVAIHDGTLGLLIALGNDWDMLRDTINETVASAMREGYDEVEIELFIDEYHVTRFKHTYDDDTAERVKRRTGRQ